MKIQDILDAANALVLIGWEATLALFTAAKGQTEESGTVGGAILATAQGFPVSFENGKWATGWI